MGLPVLGTKQIAEALGSSWCVAGLGQIAAEFAEQQAKVAMAPNQQGLECLDKCDDETAVEVVVKRAEQRREEVE